MDFKAKLKDVPEDPGVYMMLDSDGEIIYVGKAKRLKARLKQYFYQSGNKTAKVMAMLAHVADFRYIICPSEVDALVTENNLIKKHAPKYNILLKDDKSYPFLRIDMKEDFPTVRLVRKLKNDGAQYFGPYMQSVNIRDITDLIHTAFKVRDCNRDLTKPSRPCLNHHLGKCLAPCTGNVFPGQYRQMLDEILALARRKEEGKIEKLVVTGCLPQKFVKDLWNGLPEADVFAGISDYEKLPAAIEESYRSGRLNIVGAPRGAGGLPDALQTDGAGGGL